MKSNNHKYKDLAVNTVIFSISSFGSKILTFLLVPLYTSLLSTEEYGTADLISTTATLLIFVLTVDIADGVLRYAIDRKTNQEEILSFGFRVQIIGTIILAFGLLIIRSLNLIKWNDSCYVFLLLIFFFNSLHQIASNYLRAINRLKAVAISGIIQTAGIIASNIICLVVFRMGINGYLISMLFGSLISSLYCFTCFGVSIKTLIKTKTARSVQKEMVRYSFPLIFNGVAWWMNSSLDKYFITSIIGISASGIYAVSYKIPTILTMFNQIFAQAWNLSAIKEFDKDDKDGFFTKTYSVYNAGMVLCCSSLIILNVFLAKFLYAKGFFDAWKYTSPLLISIVFSALSSFIGSIFTAVKNSKIFAVSTVTAAIVNTVLNTILIPRFGIQGAAIATAISFFTIWLVRLVCVRKYIKWKINIVRDVFAYVLLSIQAVIEHFNNHNYILQVAILLVLVLLFIKEIKMIVNKVSSIIKRLTKRKEESK